MSKVAEAVFNLVSPIAQQMGLEVVEVTYKKQYDGMNLTVFIDKEEGVSLNDCERLHRAIDQPLDELDPIAEPYTLNVSSLGIDRPLKTERDYKRNLNKKISVKLYKAQDGSKTFTGILTAYDDNTFTIMTDKKASKTFNKSDVALAEPVIEI